MNAQAPPRVHRLAAVWFADIVGYTRLTSENETAALCIVDALQTSAQDAVERFGGRIVKFIGDSVLAEFASTEGALRAALLLQAEFASACDLYGVPAQLRIAVHVGDVVTTPDGDVFGDGVNRAARLQALAQPGAVVVSEDVWRQIRPRPEFRFEEIGQRRLNGIDEPVRIFAVTVQGEDAPVPGPAHSRPRRFPIPWWRPIAGTALVMLAIRFLLSGAEQPPDLDPDRIAVAPFNVASADPELRQWEEFMVDILARNLDGAGSLRTVAPSVAIRGWTGPADIASATALGRRTGAGLVVFGSLIPSGPDSARVSAAILDVAGGRVLDEVVVASHDPVRRMVQLSDSLTVAVLRALGRTRPIGAVRSASLGSLTSVPALKAFLRGEQFYRRTAWDSAIAQYQLAIEADSTFALPLRRIGVALGWQGTFGDSLPLAYKLRAGALNRGLSPRDSLLVLADSLAAAASVAARDSARTAPEYWRYVRRLFATLNDATRRYPKDPEGWYALGDAGYHLGFGPAAVPEKEILEAFDKALALDSAFAPAYVHPIELGFELGGRSLGLRYARAYLALDPTDINAEGVRIAAQLADPRRGTLPETQRLLDSASADALGAARRLLDQWPDSLEIAVQLSELGAIKRGLDPSWRERCMEYQPALARQLAYRGHLSDARCALGEAPPPSKLLAELALLGGFPADSASHMFDRWLEQGSEMLTFALPWWAMTGDTVHIRMLLGRADSLARIAPGDGKRQRAAYDTAAAQAYLALARTDTVEAIRRFTALPDTLCLNCFHLDRLTNARLLAAVGQDEAAERILRAWRGPLVFPSDIVFALEHGRLAARLGKRDKAVAAYRFIADVWVHADPILQPRVAEARSAFARLTNGYRAHRRLPAPR